jgi:hypothetical protein
MAPARSTRIVTVGVGAGSFTRDVLGTKIIQRCGIIEFPVAACSVDASELPPGFFQTEASQENQRRHHVGQQIPRLALSQR